MLVEARTILIGSWWPGSQGAREPGVARPYLSRPGVPGPAWTGRGRVGLSVQRMNKINKPTVNNRCLVPRG